MSFKYKNVHTKIGSYFSGKQFNTLYRNLSIQNIIKKQYIFIFNSTILFLYRSTRCNTYHRNSGRKCHLQLSRRVSRRSSRPVCAAVGEEGERYGTTPYFYPLLLTLHQTCSPYCVCFRASTQKHIAVKSRTLYTFKNVYTLKGIENIQQKTQSHRLIALCCH